MRWPQAVLVALLIAGCSSNSGGESDSTSASRAPSSSQSANPEPEPIADLQPIANASPAEVQPPALESKPSFSDLAALTNKSSHTRLAAETFALRLSQALIDTRSAGDLGSIVDTVAANELSPTARKSILDESSNQVQLALDRRWKTEAPMWIRSELTGSKSKAQRVNVEVAGTIAIKDPSYIGWNIVRLDIVRQGTSWKLAAVSAAPFRPADLSADRSIVVLGDQLEGTGWREIPPVK